LLVDVGEAALEELEEDPLGPLEVAGVGGIDLAIPVDAEADLLELSAEGLHVLGGDFAGVDALLDGGLLGGQAKGVPTDGLEDIEALCALVAGQDVGSRVIDCVADV